MTIMTRITRLFKADVHGMLDLLEDPEAVLEQAVRDMECQIEKNEQALRQQRELEEKLTNDGEQLEQHCQSLQGKVAASFEAGNDDLARNFIRKQLECEKQITLVGQRRKDAAKECERLATQIADERDRLRGIVEKMEIFATTKSSTAGNDASGTPQSSLSVSEDEVEIAFLKAKAEQTQANV